MVALGSDVLQLGVIAQGGPHFLVTRVLGLPFLGEVIPSLGQGLTGCWMSEFCQLQKYNKLG